MTGRCAKRKTEVSSRCDSNAGADAALRCADGRATSKPPTLPRRGPRLLSQVRFPAFHLLEEAGVCCRRVEVVQRLATTIRVERVEGPKPSFAEKGASGRSLRVWPTPRNFLSPSASMTFTDPLGTLSAASRSADLSVIAQQIGDGDDHGLAPLHILRTGPRSLVAD